MAKQKVIISPEHKLIWEDVKKAGKNALVFSSPLIILALTELQAGKSFDEIKTLVIGAAVQIAIDLFKKWNGEVKYVK